MLTIRQRGKNGAYYIRGSVTLGDKSFVVKEFSTGTSDEDAASHLKAEYEGQLRLQLMFGSKAKIANAPISAAFESYLTKSPSPCGADIIRVGKMNDVIGGMPLNNLNEAWQLYRKQCLEDHALGGQDRYRGTLQAAVNVHRSILNLEPIKLTPIKFQNQRIRYLSRAERDLLIESYAPHARPIVVMLAFHGPRIQTALQIRWGVMGVDMHDRAILFEHSKTETIQRVPMHERVYEALLPIWLASEQKIGGHVFLNCRNRPYQDTRRSPIPGGNPIKSVHKTACKRAGIKNFTVHDWRHHWASHCVMAGIDLLTIQKMGGWKSLRMVERYAAVGYDHMRDSIAKLL